MHAIIDNKADIAICDIKVVDEETNTETVSRCCNSDEFTVYNVVDNGLAAIAC